MSSHRWFRSSESAGWAFARGSFRSATPGALRRHVSRQAQIQTLHLEEFEHRVLPSFTLGDASNYAILFEGGGRNNALEINNAQINVRGSGPSQGGGIGNIGVGGAGESTVGGPSTLNGRIDFSAANTGQFSNNSAFNVITGGINYNVSAVTSALNTVNALNTTLGALPGPSPTINGNTTINAISGTFSASGPGYTNVRVFNINAFNLNNGQNLTINGDSNGDSVVLNFRGSTNFHGNVVLTGGLTPDNVLFNFVGGDLSGGGPLWTSTPVPALTNSLRASFSTRMAWSASTTPTSLGASSEAIAGISSSRASPTSPPPSTPRLRPSPRPPARPRSRWPRTP